MRGKVITTILLILFFGAGTTSAQEIFEKDHCLKNVGNGTECISYGLILADYLQTRQIQYREDLHEQNDYICGEQPSELCTAAWMLARAGTTYGINRNRYFRQTKFLGTELRTIYNVWLITTTTYAVTGNLKLGLEVKW